MFLRDAPTTTNKELFANTSQGARQAKSNSKIKGIVSSDSSPRVLTAAELKLLSRQQTKAKQSNGAPNQPSASSLALAQRIGSLPLSQRLSEQAPVEKKKPNAKKKKNAATKAKAKKAGMDVDG